MRNKKQNTPAGGHNEEDRVENRQTQAKMEEHGTKVE